MSEIFYVDPDFEKGMRDRTRFKFEMIYQGFQPGCLALWFITGLLALAFGWQLFDTLVLAPARWYEGWRETPAVLTDCKAVSEEKIDIVNDYANTLRYEFIEWGGIDGKYIQGYDILFLDRDRCKEVPLGTTITVHYDPNRIYFSRVIDGRFSSSFAGQLDKFKSVMIMFLCAEGGITGIILALRYGLARRKWRKLVDEGQFLPGQITDITLKTIKIKSETHRFYEIHYRFASPEGIALEGKFDVSEEPFSSENPPKIGTKLLILYANERCYSLV